MLKENEKREINNNAAIQKEEEEFRKIKLDNIKKSVMLKNFETINSKKEQNIIDVTPILLKENYQFEGTEYYYLIPQQTERN
jgi:hypothetical protein